MKNQRTCGFTLIELMVSVAVVAIIASLAIPAYQSQIRKGRRADAMEAIAQIQQAQERWRANNATYANQTSLTAAAPAGLGISTTSKGGYYTLAVLGPTGTSGSAPTAAGYMVRATAVAGKSQAGDTRCSPLEVVVTNGNSAPVASQSACWSK